LKAVIEVLWEYAGDRNCVALRNNESYPFRTSVVESAMKVYSAVIERCPQTGLFVGYVPGFPGAHSQGETLDEVNRNLQEVIAMLLEDGEPILESEFVGVQNVAVA
jgi:predicted RNase H-like HicB family nuclease